MSDYPYNLREKRKVFCVTCQTSCHKELDGFETPLKIFSSYQLAKNYAESRECLKGKEWHWESVDTMVAKIDDEYDMVYQIHDCYVDDSIPDDFKVPEIEKENIALTKENRQLKRELSEANVKIARAASYATMWDGGYDYTKEAILENLHMVRSILDGNKK